MLVVSRKTNEAILVRLPDGREIRIVVTKVLKSKIKLGISAPPEIQVLRDDAKVRTPNGDARMVDTGGAKHPVG